MSLGKLVLDLSLNSGQFTVELKKAEGALGAFILGANNANNSLNRLGNRTRGFGTILRDTVVTLALARDAIRTLATVTVGWQQSMIAVNGDMQRSIQLMKTFSKEADPVKATAEAMQDVTALLEKASKSPFSLKAITDSFVKLRVSGIQPVEQGFNALIDSVAQFGGNDEALKRASVAIQQMAGKGVISMEELRQQLGEAVPTAIQMMANGLGVTYAKLVKEISLGRVKSEPAIVAMFREMELSAKGSAANMMNTWGGAIAQLDTEFKKLMLTIGGFKEGYTEGTYMHEITKGIKDLTEVMKDPSVVKSAQEFAKGLTAIMQAMIDGIKWVIQYRTEIYEVGKALLTVWAATKGLSLLRSAGLGIAGMAMQLVGAGGAVRGAFTQMGAGLTAARTGLTMMGNASTAATGGMMAMKGVLGTVGGVAALATGPIGMLTVAVAAGAYAWWEYKKAAEAGTKAMIDSKGIGAGIKEMEDAQETLKDNAESIANLQKDINIAEGKESGAWGFLSSITKGYIDVVGKKKEIQRLQEQSAKLGVSIVQAEKNIMEQGVGVETRVAIQQVEVGMEAINKAYTARMVAYKARLEEGEKTGKDKDKDWVKDSMKMKYDAERDRLQAEYDAYAGTIENMKKSIEKGYDTNTKGETIKLTDDDVKKRKGAMEQLAKVLGEVGNRQIALIESSKVFADTKLDGAGGGGDKPKAFDALGIFVDGLRKKFGTLQAKVEETNPYIAQLEATIESLDGKKGPNFDKYVTEGRKLAEQVWAQEKARTALNNANKEYQDGMERIDQITTLAQAKLNKAEEMNPWEKASADAVRYEEELTDLIDKMNAAQKAATAAQVGDGGEGQLKKLAGEAAVAAAKVDEARMALEKLKVRDSTKAMQKDAFSISDSLLTDTERAKAAYERQSGYADEFFRKHKDQIEADKEALDSYYAYRVALDAQYQRDTENGLQEWIRQNEDATDQYKQLWGDAMTKFNDTLVDGLKTGKLEFGDFVEYVLTEFLRIQMAKQMANFATAMGGDTKDGFLGSIVEGIGKYFGSSKGGASAPTGDASTYTGAFGFADGGIMSAKGAVALHKYAKGGIADRPQLALFGEGSMNEAYVPLPDGRSIPVTMNTSSSQTGTMQKAGMVDAEINIYNQGGEQVEGSGQASFDGEKFVVDVVLKKLNTPGPLRDAVRGAQ